MDKLLGRYFAVGQLRINMAHFAEIDEYNAGNGGWVFLAFGS